MKDKDIFKEVFSNKLKEHSAEVNPQIWSSIQSQISAGAASTGAGGATLSTLGKIVITVVSVATVGTASFFLLQDKEELATAEKIEKTTVKDSNDTELILADENEVAIPSDINRVSKEEQKIKEENNSDNPIKSDVGESIVVSTAEENSNLEKDKNESEVVSSNESVESQISKTELEKENRVDDGVELNELTENDFNISYTLENGIHSFTVKGEKVDYISWDFGDGNYANELNCEHSYDEVGQFRVTANIVNGEKTFEKSTLINIVPVGKLLYIPDVITPNNDGTNDMFYIESENIAEMNVRIVNQNNVLQYETNDIDFLWDGVTVKGVIADQGSYMLIIKAIDIDGFPIQKTMPLTIMK